MAGEPAFFELGVQDPERARTFYGALFGWTFQPAPSGVGLTISTRGVPGGVHGADAGASPYLFFCVDDLDAAVHQVLELGGTVDGYPFWEEEEPASVTARGWFRLCRDDQGSAFGLYQPQDA
ncbi:VOC family protein [Streptomyces sp. NBC_00252]|uniref:VOC family protein n=1 Tax=Streptomyces sp. NBC_00252 TaxID=2975691 RepID=UPI002E2A1F65|nr:VOC family protein [Streptomyces sp. NBC_00252]